MKSLLKSYGEVNTDNPNYDGIYRKLKKRHKIYQCLEQVIYKKKLLQINHSFNPVIVDLGLRIIEILERDYENNKQT